MTAFYVLKLLRHNNNYDGVEITQVTILPQIYSNIIDINVWHDEFELL